MQEGKNRHLLGTMAAAPPSLLGAGPLPPTKEGRPERPVPFAAPLASFTMRAGPSDCLALSAAGLRPPSVCLRLLLLILLYTAHILELLSYMGPALPPAAEASSQREGSNNCLGTPVPICRPKHFAPSPCQC